VKKKKKRKKKKSKSGTLEVGQGNLQLMAQRVRELEDDNAELGELLDLLPAVKEWERKCVSVCVCMCLYVSVCVSLSLSLSLSLSQTKP